jgi:uncharacterized protein (TIGR00369 family)
MLPRLLLCLLTLLYKLQKEDARFTYHVSRFTYQIERLKMTTQPEKTPLDPRQILAELMKLAPEGQLELPPKIFIDMQAEVVGYEPKQSLTVRFPVLERYQNPLRMMQGGMIVAAIDNTVGPLSYLVAPPSVTTQLNTSFVRPVTPQDAYITVEARVLEVTRRQLLFSAHVSNAQNKTVAIAQITAQVVEAAG